MKADKGSPALSITNMNARDRPGGEVSFIMAMQEGQSSPISCLANRGTVANMLYRIRNFPRAQRYPCR
jgi:hypothetical protein